MPSPTAIIHGKYYHIFNRGNNGENIFIYERNYRYFLAKYAQVVFPITDTYAYCLLRNHFHLLVRIKDQDELTPDLRKKKPGQILGNFFNSYAKSFNKMYGRTGSLFENPFGRIEITTNTHLLHLVTYIHQNPKKHGFVDDFREWPYSSYHALISKEPTRLHRETVIDWFGTIDSVKDAHDVFILEEQIARLVPGDFD